MVDLQLKFIKIIHNPDLQKAKEHSLDSFAVGNKVQDKYLIYSIFPGYKQLVALTFQLVREGKISSDTAKHYMTNWKTRTILECQELFGKLHQERKKEITSRCDIEIKKVPSVKRRISNRGLTKKQQTTVSNFYKLLSENALS